MSKVNVAEYDFHGWATKNDLKCSDGRTIRRDAFIEQDGLIVPLVWKHLHDGVDNILGHGLLENREEGVYVYGKFNDTEAGVKARKVVKHGDINMLSIYANQLVEKSKNVLHGAIREVSLVMAGANPGARIVNVNMSHGDGTESVIEDEAIFTTGIKMEVLSHEEKEDTMAQNNSIAHAEETVGDVFDTLTDKQKNVVYAMIAEALDSANENMAQEDEDNGMKHNIFDGTPAAEEEASLSHDQMYAIMNDAVKRGSLKDSFLAHVDEYGIDHPDYLFPDARTITGQPTMIQRRMAWVAGVLSGTYHTPFSRIKTITADITADEARAKGYVKGSEKKDEIIRLLRRTTGPTTIYKKQKLDRDDITDITDFDVVVWIKNEMRVMIDEEVARCVLIGDGREIDSADKVKEDCIRPIYSDDNFYVERVELASTDDAEKCIEEVLRSRENYSGSGSPTMYTTTGFLNDMLLLKDNNNRRLYNTQAELETALRVSSIVEVPVMNGVHRDITGPGARTLNLRAIVVNLKDYTVGADRGGELSFFDDFDIDFNQQKYLIETRISGALVLPKSAIVIEQVAPAG